MNNSANPEYPGKDLEAMSFAVNYHQWIVDELAPFFGQNVVEVGAGVGDLTALLLQTDIKHLYAFEPASNLFPLLARNMQGQSRLTTINDYFKPELAPDVIDSVLYINVLEHIRNDLTELLMVNRALRNGGHLLLFVPALQWLFSKADLSMGHFRRYYRRDLVKLVEDTGFSIEKAHYFDISGILPWYLNFVVLKNSFNASSVALYDKIVVPAVRLLEKAKTDPKAKKEIQENDPRALEILESVDDVKDEFRNTEAMQPAAVFQFFLASSKGNELILHHNDKPTAFRFPRQRKENGLCLSDYVSPNEKDGDTVAMFVTTVGKGVRERSEQLKNRGDYLKSHILQSLAIESAEAYAELLHAQLRKMWGFPDPTDMTMMMRFKGKYRGKRYSFGYPACPRLDDQKPLFDLLDPSEAGVQLTEEFMMDPEASVSALAFHHPDSVYFSVGKTGEDSEDNQS